MHAQDGALGRVEDRRREHRAEDPAIGDRERAAAEVVHRDRPLAGLGGVAGDGLLDRREREPVGIADHRDHQPLLGADRHADVVVILIDDLVALDPGIDRGERLKASIAALTKNDMKPSAVPCAFWNGSL